jgi:O-acetyl-ADP-ribose deacetylase (regulator of RNase III)
MIREVEGNLLTYLGIKVIAHQTNCLGVMGAGIAKQIKVRNPELFKAYVRYCKKNPDAHVILGTVQMVPTDDGSQIVANLFGEYSFCESIAPFYEGGKSRHTDYVALKECFHRLHTWLVLHDVETVGIPYKIGCGLAGGDWDGVVYPMIKEEFGDDEDITLYIVKYNK